ncbi:Membrane alanyl aminopeptidase, Metallo peptidase, MEROPS family M01 [metagenome]|uniref:Membrane alanyl aminopeptidase, Metallo peptidase, MEROPS family M01 n=1 Tax=metagenome TaxID=256318 RepID=A0A2P2CDR1_9ZZZZ
MPPADNSSRSLQLTEAVARFEQLRITSYDVRLDLATSAEHFGSVTTIRFESTGGPTFVDLKPASVNRITLNGRELDVDDLDRGRLPIETTSGSNELVVDAVMRFRNDGEGLHRSVDPADKRHYVYGMSFMDAAPSIFACFDQPDLKAPYTFHVRAPGDWTVIGNAPGEQVEPGVWEFETTKPLSTYFVTVVAGPYHLVTDEHDGIPLGLSARQSLAGALEADADELLTITRQCFDEFHRLFGIRYPFGNYHQAFVPEFNAGAMENPGCVTFRDPLVFASRVTRGVRIARATTVAHEMAHQWFGNITTPKWWDDLWLNESFAEYMGNRVTADVTQYGDAWVHNAYSRRQWGLKADQRPTTHPVAGNGAVDATAALQDFDGISYAKGSSILKQLNATLGDEVFFAGAIDHFTRHRFANATMHDLFDSWQRAGAGDLSGFTDHWLRTAGPDALGFDRASGTVRRTPPADHPADRQHRIEVALAGPGSPWRFESMLTTGPATPLSAGNGEAVVIDPFEQTWAVVEPDPQTLVALTGLLPETTDPMVRAGIWNGVRSAFHNARLAPATALDLIEVGIPVEDNDDCLFHVLPWARSGPASLSDDPDAALERVHRASHARLASAEPGSTVQLAAFQSTVSSSADPAELRSWLAEQALPTGLSLDLDLRWRILVQLAALGEVDRVELQARLDAEPTARSRVEHARALASLPDAAAKQWAWQRFLGEEPVPNYELEATGLGMWRPGQEELTAPYVERYFEELPGAAKVFSGWVLADLAQWFFPATSLQPETLALADGLIERSDLDLSLRRRVTDQTDELRRRLAIRRAFGNR